MPNTALNRSLACEARLTSLLDRQRDWWAGKGLLYASVPHTALGDLWLPLADGSLATQDMDVTPDMLDLDRLAGPAQAAGPLELEGDHIRCREPFARIPWVEAILGCAVHATIQGGSMRARAIVHEWEDWHVRAGRLERDWLDALLHLTELLVQRNGGRYAVTQTLMRGPSDLAEAILGPERMCLAMYDQTAELTRFLEQVTQAFLEILAAQLERIPALEGGWVNPFGIWAPGKVVRTQCDASAFLSPAQYARWFLPYDAQICATVGYGVIHLHSGSLHTVDALLAVEHPRAIQITLDPPPSGPLVGALLPVLRRILVVKPLIVDGPLGAGEIKLLLDELPHDGLCILARQAKW